MLADLIIKIRHGVFQVFDERLAPGKSSSVLSQKKNLEGPRKLIHAFKDRSYVALKIAQVADEV